MKNDKFLQDKKMIRSYLTKTISISFFIFVVSMLFKPQTGFCFDETSMPNQQYNGNFAKAGKAASEKPKVLQGVTVQENLGKKINPDLFFTDQNGQVKKFSEMIGNKPVLLTLNYYRCTTLCSLQLLNLAKSLSSLGWEIGKDFNVVTVSFDPTDTPKDSLKAQTEYLSMAGQSKGHWNFYTGTQENIKALTEQVGYFYKYDPISKEFAHAAAIFFISPNGSISRYLYGINYPPNQIKFSLMDASHNKIGSPTDRVLLTCFHYNPLSGKYDLFAINMLRTGAAASIIILAFFIIRFLRRDKRKIKKNTFSTQEENSGILSQKK